MTQLTECSNAKAKLRGKQRAPTKVDKAIGLLGQNHAVTMREIMEHLYPEVVGASAAYEAAIYVRAHRVMMRVRKALTKRGVSILVYASAPMKKYFLAFKQ